MIRSMHAACREPGLDQRGAFDSVRQRMTFAKKKKNSPNIIALRMVDRMKRFTWDRIYYVTPNR